MDKVKLGDKAKDLVSGFEGIITNKVECLNGCNRYVLAETPKKGVKNEFRTVEIDEQQVEKMNDGLNKKNKPKQTKTGGRTVFGTMLK